MGYANVCYLSYPHNGLSQTRYLFTFGGIKISWWPVK